MRLRPALPWTLPAALLFAGALFTGCGDSGSDNPAADTDTESPADNDPSEQDTESTPRTGIRAIHLADGAPAVSVFRNNETSAPIEGLAFGRASGYVEMTPGSYSFQVKANGATVLEVPAQTYESAKRYTVAVFGSATTRRDGGLKALRLTDDATGIPSGSARIVVVHAAHLAGAVKVWNLSGASPASLIDSLAYGAAADKIDAPPGGITRIGLDLIPADGNPEAVFETGALAALAGKLVTVYAAVKDGKFILAVQADNADPITVEAQASETEADSDAESEEPAEQEEATEESEEPADQEEAIDEPAEESEEPAEQEEATDEPAEETEEPAEQEEATDEPAEETEEPAEQEEAAEETEEPAEQEEAPSVSFGFRAVHLSGNAPAIRVFDGGQPIYGEMEIGFGQAYGFWQLSGSPHDFEIRAGAATVLNLTGLAFEHRKNYSLAIYGSANPADGRPLAATALWDQNSGVIDSNVRLVLFHAAYNAGDVKVWDLSMAGHAMDLVNSLSYGQGTAPIDLGRNDITRVGLDLLPADGIPEKTYDTSGLSTFGGALVNVFAATAPDGEIVLVAHARGSTTVVIRPESGADQDAAEQESEEPAEQEESPAEDESEMSDPEPESETPGIELATELECQQLCGNLEIYCTGPNQQYANPDACIAHCMKLPRGAENAVSGNSVACRRTHLGFVMANPTDFSYAETHCPHAGPFGAASWDPVPHCGTIKDVYCHFALNFRCTGDKAIYTDMGACLAGAANFPTDGTFNDGSGNSLQCRVNHLTRAMASDAAATLHCPHGLAGGPCSGAVPNDGNEGDAEAEMEMEEEVVEAEPEIEEEISGIARATPEQCQDYCQWILALCTGANQQYPSEQLCLQHCATLQATGSGNTFQCRRTHLGFVQANPTDPSYATTHCPHAGPYGANVCGSAQAVYCDLARNFRCTDSRALFADDAACSSAAPGIPATGSFGATGGNTIQCRIYHLTMASQSEANANLHCPHGNPANTGPCSSP